METVSKVL